MKLASRSSIPTIRNSDPQLTNPSPLILTVDDDRDNLLLVNLVLSYFEYYFIMSANTQTALSLVKTEQPDLILLGINSPGIKEIELLDKLKKDSQTRYIPIVALSAIANPDYLRDLLCLGCDYCLTKPYLLEDLQKLIRNCCQLLPCFSA